MLRKWKGLVLLFTRRMEKIKSNKIAILSLIVIALITIGAIFIPMFWKYDYKTQNLELANIPDVMKVYPLDNGKKYLCNTTVYSCCG